MSPGLLRARAPYRNKNIIGGILLFGAVSGIYFYSMQAVKQDDFTDVDAEATAMRGTNILPKSIEDEEKERKEEARRLQAEAAAEKKSANNTDAYYGGRRGILAQIAPNLMGSRISWIDGAPPVDRVGLMGDKRRN